MQSILHKNILNLEKQRFKFQKKEKLKSKKEIERLFEEGLSFHQYPIRWVWMHASERIESPFPIQVSVSVSKRKFKLAVDRNRIKRLMREAWRLHKHELYEKMNDGERYSIMLIYTSKDEVALSYLENKLKKGMKIFLKKIANKETIAK